MFSIDGVEYPYDSCASRAIPPWQDEILRPGQARKRAAGVAWGLGMTFDFASVSKRPHARVTTGTSSLPDSGMGSTRISSGGGSSDGSVAVSVATTSGARNPPDWCRHSLS